MRWYITVAAVHHWQAILGLPVVDDGPGFDDAAKQLDELAQAARLAQENPGHQVWRVNTDIRGRRARIELTVVTTPRPEGPLPQLVRVRRKG